MSDLRQDVLDGIDREIAEEEKTGADVEALTGVLNHHPNVLDALRLLRVDTERHMTGRTADEYWSWLSCVPCKWFDSGPVNKEGERCCPVIRERAAVYAREGR
jgi:hypothetical protein